LRSLGRIEGACKNPRCHSKQSEESPVFSNQKIKKGDPSDLRP